MQSKKLRQKRFSQQTEFFLLKSPKIVKTSCTLVFQQLRITYFEYPSLNNLLQGHPVRVQFLTGRNLLTYQLAKPSFKA
jgi:hypothetical protein